MPSHASNDPFPGSEVMAPQDTGEGGTSASLSCSRTSTVNESPMRTHGSPSPGGTHIIMTMTENLMECFLCAHHCAPHLAIRLFIPHSLPWEIHAIVATVQMRN